MQIFQVIVLNCFISIKPQNTSVVSACDSVSLSLKVIVLDQN